MFCDPSTEILDKGGILREPWFPCNHTKQGILLLFDEILDKGGVV